VGTCTGLVALALAIVTASPAPAADASAQRGRADGGTVKVVQTTADLSQRMARLPDKRFAASGSRAGRVIGVDDHRRYQRVTGFGAAMTDTAAWLLQSNRARAGSGRTPSSRTTRPP
jgi:glucosylceramidase